MILGKGKLKFIRLARNDLELVRQWRNSPAINRYMEYRGYISSQAQVEWFNSINNFDNFYFIVEHEYKKVGLVNAKNIDWKARTAEGGVFFWDEQIYNSPLPVITFMLLADLLVKGFDVELYAHVLKSNRRAIRYNTILGFKLCEGQEEVENQLYLLSKENYLHKTEKIRRAFNLMVDKSPLTLTFDQSDIDSGFEKQVVSQINPSVIEEFRDIDRKREYRLRV
jgi:RimJ/RimL family protein N-acetyltransferase